MPFKNTACYVHMMVWDTSANIGKTGDTANLTFYAIRDNGAAAVLTAPSPTEVNATYMKGVYRISLSAGENNGTFVTVGGSTITANCVVIPRTWCNEINSDTVKWAGTAPTATSQAGTPVVEVTRWLSQPCAAVTQAGVPEVDVTYWKGVAADDLATEAEVAAAVRDVSNAAPAAGSVGENIASILTDTAEIGAAGAGLTNINLPNQTMDITGNITGNLSGSVGSVTGAVGSVTGAVASVTGAVGSVSGNVGGNVVGSVGSVAGNVSGSVASVTGAVGSVTGAVGSVAANGITAASLAADAGTEIGTAVWASAARTLTSAASFQVKKNTELPNFPFVMTDSTTHAPKTLVTVACQRSIDGAAFGACANTPATEVGNGWYKITLANTDLNGTTIALRFIGTDSDDLNITIVTQA